MARSQEEAQCLSYLDDHVITDEVYKICEELIWETLWDDARKVGKQKTRDLEDAYCEKEADPSVLKVLRDNYTRPVRPHPEGNTLLYCNYGELLYHLNRCLIGGNVPPFHAPVFRLMQRGSLMENYAIKKLQEQIITQVGNPFKARRQIRVSGNEKGESDAGV